MTKIRELMQARQWGVTDLMRASGLSMPTASKATGEGWPDDNTPLGTVRALARTFGVPVVDLLSEADHAGNGKPADPQA